jgi:hypothetical protein
MNIAQTIASIVHPLVCKTIALQLGVGGQFTLYHLPGNASATSVQLWMLRDSQDETWQKNQQHITGSSKANKFEWAIQQGYTGAVGEVAIGDKINDQIDTYIITKLSGDSTNSITTAEVKRDTARMI